MPVRMTPSRRRAALVIGSQVRGGRIIADPAVVREWDAHRRPPPGVGAGSSPAPASAAASVPAGGRRATVRPSHDPVTA
jgi:hypothetical protein